MEGSKIETTAVKVGMLGDSTVGKTAICGSFMNLEFSEDQMTTVGVDKIEKKIKLKNGKEIKLVLWDTAGEERFKAAALKIVRNAQGVVLVFDVTNEKSFKNITDWLETIKDNFKNPSIVLFGNKVDIDQSKWKVSEEQAEELAKKMNLTYFATSAKTKQGLDEGFSYIANEIYEKIEAKPEIKVDDNIHIEDPDEEYEIFTGCFGKKKKVKKKNNSKNKKK